MRKQRRLILFFALAVFIYGLAQVWNQQRSSRFETLLLDFLPKKVVRVQVDPSQGGQPFTLLLHDDRWLITAHNINEAALPGSVWEMLSYLNEIRTTAIVGKGNAVWEEYGVGEQQGVKICLFFDDESSTCIRLSTPPGNNADPQALVYARLEGQPEVYACRAISLQYLDGTVHTFRKNCLLNLQTDPHTLVMEWRDTTLVANLDTGVWHLNQLPVGDAAAWHTYTATLRHPCGDDFVDDLDEIALDSLLYWQLTLYTRDDSVFVQCYRDTQRVQPYLLHASQYPHLWLSSDSAGLFRLFTDVWSKNGWYE